MNNLNGCVTTAYGTVSVNPIPIVNLSNVTICEGDTANLNAIPSITGGSFLWTPGGNGSQLLNVSPNINTNYSVIYTLNGCSSMLSSATVSVNTIPTVNLPNVSICQGDSAFLTAVPSLPGGTYLWNPGGASSSSIMVDSSYNSVNVVYTLNGCSSPMATSQITIQPLPSSTFIANNIQGCSPLIVELTADSISSSSIYDWSISNGSTYNGSSVSFTLTSGGYYDVTLTVMNNNSCIHSTTLNSYIYVEEPPIASFSSSVQSFTDLNQEVVFYNNSFGATNYIWSFGDGDTSFNENVDHFYSNTINGYQISLAAFSLLGCIDTTSIIIPYEDGLVFHVPNSFTPDGDMFNQTFTPVFTSGFDINQFTMSIYNRWGEIVFQSKDASIGWDGNYGLNGRKAQDGVYTYHIVYKIPQVDDRRVLTGHVTLIR